MAGRPWGASRKAAPGGSAGLQALTGRQLEISADVEAIGEWQNFFQRIEVTVAT